ncbi:hypothetical protein FQR65_LT13241 [Abscondita terminalis]|nr:hypothetical protein FQR65_LT13241 [Abscondita terminalis]
MLLKRVIYAAFLIFINGKIHACFERDLIIILDCPPDEIMDPCKRLCQPTCQKPIPEHCFYFGCTPGCVCKNGLIRDELSGICIDPESCPTNCAEDEIENKLSVCEPSCPTKTVKTSRFVEIKKCVCKPGLVRNKDTNECVPLHECPNECSTNEYLSNCTNTACRRTCQNKHKELQCKFACEIGCACKDNYIWDENQSQCVHEKDCSPECGENEEYRQCSDKLCKITCENIGQPMICAQACIPGCSCKPDYIYDKDQNKCIHKSFCSKDCKINEEWSNCINSCQETCHYPGKQFCTKQCKSGCGCKKGFLWDKYKMQCVEKHDCTKNCGKNQEWCEYIPGDLPTCQSLHEPVIRGWYSPTFIELKPGCICKSGFILNEDDGECIELSDCFKFHVSTSTTIEPNTELNVQSEK